MKRKIMMNKLVKQSNIIKKIAILAFFLLSLIMVVYLATRPKLTATNSQAAGAAYCASILKDPKVIKLISFVKEENKERVRQAFKKRCDLLKNGASCEAVCNFSSDKLIKVCLSFCKELKSGEKSPTTTP